MQSSIPLSSTTYKLAFWSTAGSGPGQSQVTWKRPDVRKYRPWAECLNVPYRSTGNRSNAFHATVYQSTDDRSRSNRCRETGLRRPYVTKTTFFFVFVTRKQNRRAYGRRPFFNSLKFQAFPGLWFLRCCRDFFRVDKIEPSSRFCHSFLRFYVTSSLILSAFCHYVASRSVFRSLSGVRCGLWMTLFA